MCLFLPGFRLIVPMLVPVCLSMLGVLCSVLRVHRTVCCVPCVEQFFAQFNVLAISMVSLQRLKNEKNEQKAQAELEEEDLDGDPAP